MSDLFEVDVNGMKVFGRRRAATPSASLEKPPLIVAFHGGGFTSAYFDSGRYSLLHRAAAAGCPAIALDRPGYGATPRLAAGDGALARNADLLNEAISRIWRDRDFDAGGVVLVGHSVGGGIINYLAGETTDWPLLGVAISGVLAAVPSNVYPFWNDLPPSDWIKAPFDRGLLFGPPGSYPEAAAELCESIGVPLWTREAIEMFSILPNELADLGARIRVPMLIHSDDLAAIKGDGEADLRLLKTMYPNAASVTTKFVPNAGHCIDFHHAGETFQEEQIAFAIDCARHAALLAA